MKSRLPALLLLLAAIALFLPNLGGYFVSDDFVLLDWTHGRSMADLPGFFDPNTFWFYRPGVKVYYWLGQSLFGLHAAPFHLFSLALHALNGYLLYRLVVRQKGTTQWAGVLAALLFMLVPYHAETVSWVAATGDLVAAASVLGSLHLVQHYHEREQARYAVLSVALFALGLFTRETAVMLPLLYIFLVVIMREPGDDRFALKKVALPLACYALIPALYVGIQAIGQSSYSALARGGLSFRDLSLTSILLGIGDYVNRLLPGGGFVAALPLDTLDWVIWLEALLLAAMAFVLWRTGLRLALFGLAWLLTTPLLFVFFNATTDRYFYLPSIGYAILIAALVQALPLLRGIRTRPALQRLVLSTSLLVVALIIISHVPRLLTRLEAWRHAGALSGGVIADTVRAVPEPEDYSAFYYVGMPLHTDGIPVFGNGIQQAAQLVYQNSTITANFVTCSELQRGELPRYSYFFSFKGDGVLPLANREACAAP